jgi:hypothetical protein
MPGYWRVRPVQRFSAATRSRSASRDERQRELDVDELFIARLQGASQDVERLLESATLPSHNDALRGANEITALERAVKFDDELTRLFLSARQEKDEPRLVGEGIRKAFSGRVEGCASRVEIQCTKAVPADEEWERE